MPSQEEFDQLKGRIVELENQLKAQAGRSTPDFADLTAEELQAYVKVRDVLESALCMRPPCWWCCAPCAPCSGPAGAWSPGNVRESDRSGVQRFENLGG